MMGAPRIFRIKLTPLVAALLLSACIYVPRTTETYDADCRTVEKHMELEQTQVGGFAGCQNKDCLVLLAAAGVVTAASVVVSGSIVVTGNIVYWLERQGRCQKFF